jgi:hypothetical protein
MTNESADSGRPPAVDRTTFQAELDKLRAREKAHTRQDDAIALRRSVRPGTGRAGPTPQPIPLLSGCVRPNGYRRAR